MNIDLKYVFQVIRELLKYLPITLYLTLVTMIIALIIVVVLDNILVYKIPILFQVDNVYLSFFRGAQVLVQLLMIYFGLPQLFVVLNDLGAGTAAIIAFSLNTSSYLAEIYLAGLESVDR